MKHLIFIYFLLSITFCFGQNEFKTYTKDNYTINYPESWILDTSGRMNTAFLIFSKLASKEDRFKENVNFMVQNLAGMNLDMDGYVKISEQQISATPQSKTLVSKKEGDKYIMIWQGFINGYTLKFKQYFYIIKEKAYILTFTATLNEYDNYIKTGNKILDSFKLTN